MGSERSWLIVGVVLVFAVDSAAATELGVDGSRFTVDGQQRLVLGISYYRALGVPNQYVRQDLDVMQRSGFNWIHVWSRWSAFSNDVSAVDGSGRAPYLAQLKWLVENDA